MGLCRDEKIEVGKRPHDIGDTSDSDSQEKTMKDGKRPAVGEQRLGEKWEAQLRRRRGKVIRACTMAAIPKGQAGTAVALGAARHNTPAATYVHVTAVEAIGKPTKLAISQF